MAASTRESPHLRPERLLADAAVGAPPNTGVVFGDQLLTYRELGDAVPRFSAALEEAAGGQPNRVGLWISNRPCWAPLVEAIWSLGAEAVLMSAALPSATAIEFAMEQSVDVLVVPADAAQEGWPGWAGGILAVDKSLRPLRIERRGSLPSSTERPKEAAAVLFTSGTTGRPKPIAISTRQIAQSLESTLSQFGSDLERARQGSAQTYIVVFPLYHISGMFLLLLSTMLHRTAVLGEKFNASWFTAALEKHEIGHVTLNPAMIERLLEDPTERAVSALGRLRSVRTGSAPLARSTKHRFEAAFGVPILEGYGTTETVGEIAGWTLRDMRRYGQSKEGSVGRPHPSTTVEILDDDNGLCVAGTEGQIWVTGPTTGGRRVSTGDLGYLDADGFLFLVGRVDDQINCGGFKISPAVLEQVLGRCEGVSAVAVVAEPDRVLGQVPVAFVVANGGNTTAEQVLAFARRHLPAYQCPRRVEFVDELPRNEMGKMLRRNVTSARRDTP